MSAALQRAVDELVEQTNGMTFDGANDKYFSMWEWVYNIHPEAIVQYCQLCLLVDSSYNTPFLWPLASTLDEYMCNLWHVTLLILVDGLNQWHAAPGMSMSTIQECNWALMGLDWVLLVNGGLNTGRTVCKYKIIPYDVACFFEEMSYFFCIFIDIDSLDTIYGWHGIKQRHLW